MKANYPVEFMAALMTAEAGDEDKIYAAVEECEKLGIEVLPPDVNESLGDFTVVDEKTIRFGLNAIKNLGSDVIKNIIESRSAYQESGNIEPFKSVEDFLIRSHTKNFNKRSWEALVKAGALDHFGERGQLLGNTEMVLEFMRDHFRAESQGQSSLFGSEMHSRLTLKKFPPATKEEKLMWEKEHLGMFVSSHPLESYSRVLSTMNQVKELDLKMLGSNKLMGGIVSKVKKTLTKKNDPMAFFTLGDLSGTIEVLVFPNVMEKTVHLLENDKLVQVKGRLSDKDEEFKLIADEITELPNDESYVQALSEMEKSKKVTLHMSSLGDKDILNKIKEILKNHPGNAQVFLSLGVGPNAKVIKTQTKVTAMNGLMKELRDISEISKVDVG